VTRPTFILALLLLAACSPPAPPAPSTPTPAPRPAQTATPRPDPAAVLAVVVLNLEEAGIPPAEPTMIGLAVGRPTPTPAATPETSWKYVTVTFAVENRSDTARLVGIAGGDPGSTNLANATLTARDGTRYKAFRSYSNFGLRTASARSLTAYPVLLRLPAGFRAAAESFGSTSTSPPRRNSITFKVPATLADYGTLTIPALTTIGGRGADDEVAKRLRPLIGSFQPLNLSGVRPGEQQVAFPSAAPPAAVLAVGAPVSVPGKFTVTLAGTEVSSPADFQARNRGWKQVAVALHYRNDDPSQARGFTVSAWLFGEDGVVYSGDVPALGDFSRVLVPPEANIMSAWDGRSAGADAVPAGQEQEPRRTIFLVPRELQGGILALAGEVDALYRIEGLPQPTRP
jgi:hypothetical protein